MHPKGTASHRDATSIGFVPTAQGESWWFILPSFYPYGIEASAVSKVSNTNGKKPAVIKQLRNVTSTKLGTV